MKVGSGYRAVSGSLALVGQQLGIVHAGGSRSPRRMGGRCGRKTIAKPAADEPLEGSLAINNHLTGGLGDTRTRFYAGDPPICHPLNANNVLVSSN